MFCSSCGHEDTKVLESRLSHEGRAVRRRRMCQNCGHRYTTYEKEEDFVFSIRKKDGRVEPYDRMKLQKAMQTACQKRPIDHEKIDICMNRIEAEVQKSGEKTIPAELLGNLTMNELLHLDKIAYLRFASVYKDFRDLRQFMDEVSILND